MKKTKYYIETTIFNFKFADDEPIKRDITMKFFENWPNIYGEMYISDVVNEEIARAPEDKRIKMIELIKQYDPILLSLDEECKELGESYVSEGIIPLKYRNDALHISVAVINDLDVIISWNLEHIVKLKTKLGIEGVNKLLGYKSIEIVTPEEVL